MWPWAGPGASLAHSLFIGGWEMEMLPLCRRRLGPQATGTPRHMWLCAVVCTWGASSGNLPGTPGLAAEMELLLSQSAPGAFAEWAQLISH